MYRIFIKLLLLQILTPIITIETFIIFGMSTIGYFLSFIAILLPIITYLLSELIFLFKMRKLLHDGKFEVLHNDIKYENRIYLILSLNGLILFILLMFLMIVF